MCTQDVALYKLQWLICHKAQATNQSIWLTSSLFLPPLSFPLSPYIYINDDLINKVNF